MTFKPVRWLTDDEIDAALAQGKSPTALSAITMTVAQADRVESDAESIAKPAVEEKEPTKRKSDKPTTETKKDLKNVLDQWAD